MVEFLRVRRWEKRNRINFYWVMPLMYTIWKYRDIFVSKSYAWRLDIVQNVLRHFPSKYRKYVKQFITCYNSSRLILSPKCPNTRKSKNIPGGKNVLIPPILKLSQGGKRLRKRPFQRSRISIEKLGLD